jgi:hypothetical protein
MEFPEGRFMECLTHGKQRPAFVCEHLHAASTSSPALGFFQPTVVDLSRWDAYNGWCSACEEALRQSGGEWNERSEQFSRPTLICLGCFRELHQRHAVSLTHGLPP